MNHHPGFESRLRKLGIPEFLILSPQRAVESQRHVSREERRIAAAFQSGRSAVVHELDGTRDVNTAPIVNPNPEIIVPTDVELHSISPEHLI
jgi:hypothetical protein